MRHFHPYSAVVAAVKQSKFLDVNQDDEVSRKIPLDDKFTYNVAENKKLLHQDNMHRSIYAKGFGEEDKDTFRDIEELFAPFNMKSLRLRREEDQTFKGSVFVEFEDEQTQQDFLNMDPKPEFKGKPLEIMSKQAYVDMKHQGIIDGLVEPKSPRGSSYRGRSHQYNDNYKGGRGGGKHRGRGGKGKGYDKHRRDSFDKDKRGFRRREYRRDLDPDRSDSDGERDRSRSPDRRRYKGDRDDWKKRREYDQKEDGRPSRKDRPAKRERTPSEDGIDRLMKKSKTEAAEKGAGENVAEKAGETAKAEVAVAEE
jgi:lupus La protein